MLANTHISMFQGIEESGDLFEYFQQPKLSAVFHERFTDLRHKIRSSLLRCQHSGALIGDIVLNPEKDDEERMTKLRETWEEKMFSKLVEEKLKMFLQQNKEELNCYNI